MNTFLRVLLILFYGLLFTTFSSLILMAVLKWPIIVGFALAVVMMLLSGAAVYHSIHKRNPFTGEVDNDDTDGEL